jgi:hypothetical protein
MYAEAEAKAAAEKAAAEKAAADKAKAAADAQAKAHAGVLINRALIEP